MADVLRVIADAVIEATDGAVDDMEAIILAAQIHAQLVARGKVLRVREGARN
jgi:hypothetical protein